jgi:integrase
MFGWAQTKGATAELDWGVGTNPAKGVQRFHEEERERWLTLEEMERFANALEEYPECRATELKCSEKQKAHMSAEAKRICNAIRLVMVTGSRKGEVLSARWHEFDLQRGIWTKPSHHTKQKRKEHVPLSEDAISLLKSILPDDDTDDDDTDDDDTDLVFPGRLPGEPFTDVTSAWGKICSAAGITEFRPHDLRHNYASYLVSSGISLSVVGKLLGHTQPQTTWRYAHVADAALRTATNQFGDILTRRTDNREEQGKE